MKLRVHGGRPLRGDVALPVDLSVAQRALAVAALCSHATSFEEELPEHDPMAGILRALGVPVERGPASTRVTGVGIHGLSAPAGALDAARAPLAFAITAGLLSAQRFGTRVLLETPGEGPAPAIASVLRARGAMIAEGNLQAPGPHGSRRTSLAVAPLVDDEALREIEVALPVPSELTKTALLFSGLAAVGPTTVGEPLASADHTERWLMAAGVPMRRLGSVVGFDPSEHEGALCFASAREGAGGERVLGLPGDTSVASLLALVATVVPKSDVRLGNVGWNPTRTGVLDALRLSGAGIEATSHGDGSGAEQSGHEPLAEARITPARLRGGPIDGELLARAGSAAPLLAALGACTSGGVTLHDAAFCPELQPRPWPRLAAALEAFGVSARVLADQSLRIEPAARLAPARFDAQGHPALGFLGLALALIAGGESVLEGLPSLDEHWPGLVGVLAQLGARIEVEP